MDFMGPLGHAGHTMDTMGPLGQARRRPTMEYWSMGTMGPLGQGWPKLWTLWVHWDRLDGGEVVGEDGGVGNV